MANRVDMHALIERLHRLFSGLLGRKARPLEILRVNGLLGVSKILLSLPKTKRIRGDSLLDLRE